MDLEDGRHVLEADEVEAPPGSCCFGIPEEKVPKPGVLLTTAALQRLVGGAFRPEPNVCVAVLPPALARFDPWDGPDLTDTFTQIVFRRQDVYNIPPHGNKAYIWERMP